MSSIFISDQNYGRMAENNGQCNKGIESQVKTVYRYNSKCTLNSNIPFVDY